MRDHYDRRNMQGSGLFRAVPMGQRVESVGNGYELPGNGGGYIMPSFTSSPHHVGSQLFTPSIGSPLNQNMDFN